MRRVLLGIVGLIVLAAGAWQLRDGVQELTGPSGNAKLAAASAAAQMASAVFVKRADGAAKKSGQPPRASDPAIKALLDTVFDTAILQHERPAFEDLGAINDWLNAVLKVVTVYTISGTGMTDVTHGGDDPATGARIERNIIDFAPEYGSGIDAQLNLIQAETELVSAKLGTDPSKIEDEQRRRGFETLRAGLNKTLGGTLAVLALPDLTDDWRRDRLAALDAIAPKAMPLLDPAQAKTLHDMALEIADSETDAEVQAGLKRFAAALAT